MSLVINKAGSTEPSMFSQKEISHSRLLLQTMSDNWHRRSQVGRIKERAIEESRMPCVFNASKDDFRIDLLPFREHPDFLSAPKEMKQKILSCGWLAYNEKTIDIEAKVVSPSCYHIIYGEVPGADDGTCQIIASDTLVDEAYHIQLVLKACRMTREQRGLKSLKLPSFHLVTNMLREQSRWPEPWQKILVQIATAIISEVFVSDYLALLSTDATIQPFNRLTVETHRRDEMSHSGIFRHLAKCIYSQLDRAQQEFFIDILPKPVAWFANSELGVWRAMLAQIGFPKTEQIVADCLAADEVNLMHLDYSKVTLLAEELGILNSDRGIDSFGRAGLLNSV